MKYFYNNGQGFVLTRDNNSVLIAANSVRPSMLRHMEDFISEKESGFNIGLVVDAFIDHLYENLMNDFRQQNPDLMQGEIQTERLESLNPGNFIEILDADNYLCNSVGQNYGIFTYIIRDGSEIKIDGQRLEKGEYTEEDQEIMNRMLDSSMTQQDRTDLAVNSGDVNQGTAAANIKADGNVITPKISISLVNIGH